MRLLVISLLVGLALGEAYAQPTLDFLAGGLRLSGGAIDFYSGTELEPSLLVRLDKVYTDYQSKGFFRIGLLPIGVMEGVTFRLEHPESVTNGLAHLHQWLGGKGARRLELRRVKFLVPGAVTNHLEASRVRIAAGGSLELLDGVRFVAGTNQIEAARARLQITGERAGQILLEATPPYTNSLFGRIETLKPLNPRNLQ
jgi:hypothetical protein